MQRNRIRRLGSVHGRMSWRESYRMIRRTVPPICTAHSSSRSARAHAKRNFIAPWGGKTITLLARSRVPHSSRSFIALRVGEPSRSLHLPGAHSKRSFIALRVGYHHVRMTKQLTRLLSAPPTAHPQSALPPPPASPHAPAPPTPRAKLPPPSPSGSHVPAHSLAPPRPRTTP